MKKYLGSVLVLLLCGLAFAQTTTPPPVVPPVPALTGIAAMWAFLKPFLVAILATNAVMTLAHAILAKIPVVGPYLTSIFDVFMANPSHVVPPKP